MSETPVHRFPFVLVASVVVNALLVGLIIGGGLAGRKAESNPLPGGDIEIVRALDLAVPDDQRRAVRQAMRKAYVASREPRASVHSARQDLAGLLAAEPYDRAAVADAFMRLRLAEDAAKTALHEALATQLGALSVEQRQLILRGLSARERRGRGHGERRDGERGPPQED